MFCTFQQEKVVSLPVVLPSKQSTANSFGQMQITSLTPKPKSILQQARKRREKTGRRKKQKKQKKRKAKTLPDKTSAGFAHLCQAERVRPAVTERGERERD